MHPSTTLKDERRAQDFHDRPHLPTATATKPDDRGHFGEFGGRYVAETLMPLILDLEKHYRAAQADPAFAEQFDDLLQNYVGRPSPLYYAESADREVRKDAPAGKGAQIWFKRDELNHTGAHKINNCIGQILLAMRMGKTRIIAETGAGQHGVATATVCAASACPATSSWARPMSRGRRPTVPHETARREVVHRSPPARRR